jgi:hypothetical protein
MSEVAHAKARIDTAPHAAHVNTFVARRPSCVDLDAPALSAWFVTFYRRS